MKPLLALKGDVHMYNNRDRMTVVNHSLHTYFCNELIPDSECCMSRKLKEKRKNMYMQWQNYTNAFYMRVIIKYNYLNSMLQSSAYSSPIFIQQNHSVYDG